MQIILCSRRRSASGKRAIGRATSGWFKKASGARSCVGANSNPVSSLGAGTTATLIPRRPANAQGDDADQAAPGGGGFLHRHGHISKSDIVVESQERRTI